MNGQTLLTKRETAQWARCSIRNLDQLVKARRFPEPVRLGGKGAPRWRVAELEAWAREGCPATDGKGGTSC